MRILHLIDSGGLYGAEMVVVYLMVEQVRNGLRPTLGSIGGIGSCAKAIESVSQEHMIDVKKFRFRDGVNVLGALSIVSFAKQCNFDIIHCHGYKANILMGILSSQLRKIPHIVTLHGWTSPGRFSKMRLYEWIDTIMAQRATKAVVVSHAMRSHYRTRVWGLNPTVVRNGIPHIGACEDPSQELVSIVENLRRTTFVIAAIGRLLPAKGFDVLLNAIAEVLRQGCTVSLVIMGDGSERAALESLAAERGIMDRVFFFGYVKEASRFFGLFDLFVITSFSEGLPIVLLEAMRSGVPIVGTCVGGIPEALDNGKCGVLVNAGNEQELAHAIVKLSNAPGMRAQLSMAAKHRVAQEFSVQQMEQGYRTVYEKILCS